MIVPGSSSESPVNGRFMETVGIEPTQDSRRQWFDASELQHAVEGP